MIISHKYKLIFITTPKCGSHTGFKLMRDYFGAIPTGFNHNRTIPHHLKHYLKFTFVRNPYERFVALYHACVINDTKHWVPKQARISILDYAKWYAQIVEMNKYVRPDLTRPQWFWHKDTLLDFYIHIENAQEYMNNTYPELNIKMPHELKRNHPTWDDVKTPELTKLVNIWAGKDFERFGYECENSSS